MKPVCVLRHEDGVGGGHITDTMDRRGIPHELVAIDQGDKIPTTIDDVSGLVFLGGTMGVNDPLPWIDQELELIRIAYERKLPVLGHCLGSQLISKALGGTVTPMPAKEIGWHVVSKIDNPASRVWLHGAPDSFETLLWHRDEFSIPTGASPLYESRFCPNQAFVIDNMLATVAHIEITAAMLNNWLDTYAYELAPISERIQTAAQIRDAMSERVGRMQDQITDRLYRRWLQLVLDHQRTTGG